MKTIIGLVLLTLGSRLCAMEQTLIKEDQEAQVVPHLEYDIKKDAIEGTYLSDYNTRHPGAHISATPTTCAVAEGCFAEVNPWIVHQAVFNNTFTRAMRSTLYMVNTLKKWIDANMPDIEHTFKTNQITIDDVKTFMGGENAVYFHPADCLELILRFICTYYRDFDVVLSRIGFDVYCLSDSTDQVIASQAETTAADGSTLEFSKAYFRVDSQITPAKFTADLFVGAAHRRFHWDQLFECASHLLVRHYRFPVLVHAGMQNGYMLHALQKDNGKALQQAFRASPGPEPRIGWVENRGDLYDASGLVIAIVPYVINPDIPGKFNNPHLTRVANELRRKIIKEPSVWDPVKDNVVCSLQ